MAPKEIDTEMQPAAQDSSRSLHTLDETSETKLSSPEFVNMEAETPDQEEYSHGAQLTALVVSLMLGMFLVALDNVSCTLSRHTSIADWGCC
jgi:hypothetical protein